MPFQATYASDPTLADAVFDLLDPVFPGIHTARAHGEAFGATWESASTPFVAREGGRVLAHAGLMRVPMVVAGRPVTVGAVHGVATHPSCRRRGLYRSVMEELLSSAAAERLGTLALTTAHPEYFEPFAFRVVPESVFRAQVSPRRGPSASRQLDLPGSAADRALVLTSRPTGWVAPSGRSRTISPEARSRCSPVRPAGSSWCAGHSRPKAGLSCSRGPRAAECRRPALGPPRTRGARASRRCGRPHVDVKSRRELPGWKRSTRQGFAASIVQPRTAGAPALACAGLRPGHPRGP